MLEAGLQPPHDAEVTYLFACPTCAFTPLSTR